ncbi:hypothetical protein BC829DRAFT_415745 [Chytridium lagenaria]|nr:hypothetical protein BC829DRAFT_415745 [Chytridium lagenaria]
MFTFCPGFEAATLKLPTPGEDNDNIPQYKKQIIGFVKFRTRLDALQARDVLNGRKVDAERGCMLKAEIAKKNLHTKRGLSIEHITMGTPFPNLGRLNVSIPMLGGPLSAGATSRSTVLPSPKDVSSSFADAFFLNSPIPRDLMGASSIFPPVQHSMQHQPQAQTSSQQPTPTPLHPSQSSQASAFDYFSGAIAAAAERSLQTSRRGSPTSSIEATTTSMTDSNRSSGSSAGDLSEFRSASLLEAASKFGGAGRSLDSPRFGPFVESLIDPPPPSVVSSVSAARSQSERGFSSALYNSDSLLPNRLPPSLTINTNLANIVGGLHSPTSATMPSPSTPFATLPPGPASAGPLAGPGYRSLADQNPPCNTLYVGNLPNNASEEELRQLFCRCPGYKRLCFRQRPNGPMCFVEFEDVHCAHQALLELHGNPLTNSVKGGIRLSFSKNPLGVRQLPSSQPGSMGALAQAAGGMVPSVTSNLSSSMISNSSITSSTSSSSSSGMNLMGGSMEKDGGRLIFSC